MPVIAVGALACAIATGEKVGESVRAWKEGKARLKETQKDLSVAQQIGALHRENDELRLYLACCISLLIRKGLVTKKEFGRLAAIVDQADGVADGRFSGTIAADGSLSAETEVDDLRLRELAKVVQGIK